MVVAEHAAHLVVGEEQDAQRRAAERDRHAQNRAWIERAVGPGLALHRLHEGLLGRHHLLADVATELQRELLGRFGVGAKASFQNEPSAFVQRQTPDLRG